MAGAPPWLGLNSSEVASVCEKSISAVTVEVVAADQLKGRAPQLLASTSPEYAAGAPPLRVAVVRARQLAGAVTHAHGLGVGFGHAGGRRCTIPAICARSGAAAAQSVSITEADGLLLLAEKPFWLGSAAVHPAGTGRPAPEWCA